MDPVGNPLKNLKGKNQNIFEGVGCRKEQDTTRIATTINSSTLIRTVILGDWKGLKRNRDQDGFITITVARFCR